MLSTVFGISKSSIKRAVANVREALNKNFVPRYLGFGHISRAEVIENHTRPLAQTLFGSDSEAILVLDGTYMYIYLQKSGNFQFQRRTYSLHKGRPLVKPMVVITTTGYCIAILGPYMADAKNNDGSILNHMLASNVQDIKNWIEKEDIFIVDRGFRDSLDFLEDFGINAKMPSFLQKGQAQMTTEEANTSRLVTKVRWVVESANERIKSWRYLANVLPTNKVPYIKDYICIVCALANKYLPPLATDQDNDEALAAKMLHLSHRINTLKQRVEDENLGKRT